MGATKKSEGIEPPRHLSAPMRRWWRRVERACELDHHDRHLLRLCCEAYDQAQDARRAIAKHGSVFLDRWGQPRERPEVRIVRECRRDFAALLKQLEIPDQEVPRE